MEDQIITFKIEGPTIREEYPLYEVIHILEDFHSILDHSYLVLAGKNRMTHTERQYFKILSTRAKAGSLIHDLKLVSEVAEPLLPFIPQLTSSGIWQSAKAAFDFLKFVASLHRDGKKHEVSAPDNKGIMIVNSPGIKSIEITQNVYQIAESSRDSYKTLSGRTDEERIRSISAMDNKNSGIMITSDEKELFNPKTKIEEEPVEISGRIFDFNIDKLSGKFRVAEKQAIKTQDYNFSLLGNQDFIPYVIAMTKEQIRMRCLLEVEKHPTGFTRILRLLVQSLVE